MTALLRLSKVSVAFGGVKAVDNVSFDVHPREVLAVIGPNGAGKSTLLNAICGSVRRSTGEILLEGVPLAGKACDVARLRLARSFQHPRLLLEETVRENLLLGLMAYERRPILARLGLARLGLANASAADAERGSVAAVAAVADAFQLTGLLDTCCGHLPYGTQKLVDIARAFVGQPRLVLLDEPSSGLDNTETLRFGAMIQRIATERGLTLLVVEHDMELVRQLGDRVLALEAGAVAAQGATHEVLNSLGLARTLMGLSANGDAAPTLH